VLNLPLWMAVPLAQRGFVDPVIPKEYQAGAQSELRKGPEGTRLRDKCQNYFEVGLRIAWLTDNTDLAAAIFTGVIRRIRFIIDHSVHSVRDEAAEAGFLHLLTNFEEKIYMAGVGANEEYDRWRHGFLNEIKPLVPAIAHMIKPGK
jgi:hypothetical protein